jgi:hypothetical protein
MPRRQVTVRKLDHQGQEVTTYPGCLLHRTPHIVVLGTRWHRAPMDLDYVVLEPDDRWLEVFYAHRWYNVFEIYTEEGKLKGWYCDITRPARIGEGEVVWEDLALDVWCEPGQQPLVLDRDEFAKLPLDPPERAAARAALAQLLDRFQQRGRPFDRQEELWMRRWRSEWGVSCESED